METLNYKMYLNSNQAEKKLDEMEKKSSKLGNTLGNVNSTVKRMVVGIAALKMPLGLSLGLTYLIKQGHDLNMMMNQQAAGFRGMSDQWGNSTQVVSQMYGMFDQTKIGLNSIKGAMESIQSLGVLTTHKSFERLVGTVGNLHQATGIAVETLGELTAGLMHTWQVSEGGARKALNNMLYMNEAFGMSNEQIGAVMKTATNLFTQLGPFLKNATASANSLTKGIAGAAGAMHKLGITVEQSSNFFNKVLDPNNINENLALFARLGISYEETMEMMTSADGQEHFIDKMMQNIPALSRQIQSLKNPMARLQFSQSLGLPLEIAQKMANATAGEVEQLMQDYKVHTKDQEASRKRQQKMAAENERFEDKLHILKMQSLAPMMDLANDLLPAFWSFLKEFSKVFRVIASGIAQVVRRFIQPMLTEVNNGKGFQAIIEAALRGLREGIAFVLSEVSNWLSDNRQAILNTLKEYASWAISTMVNGVWGLLKTTFSEGGFLGKLLVGYLGVRAVTGVATGIAAFKAVRGPSGSRRDPYYVTFSRGGGASGGGSLLGTLFSKGGIKKVFTSLQKSVVTQLARFGGILKAAGGKISLVFVKLGKGMLIAMKPLLIIGIKVIAIIAALGVAIYAFAKIFGALNKTSGAFSKSLQSTDYEMSKTAGSLGGLLASFGFFGGDAELAGLKLDGLRIKFLSFMSKVDDAITGTFAGIFNWLLHSRLGKRIARLMGKSESIGEDRREIKKALEDQYNTDDGGLYRLRERLEGKEGSEALSDTQALIARQMLRKNNIEFGQARVHAEMVEKREQEVKDEKARKEAEEAARKQREDAMIRNTGATASHTGRTKDLLEEKNKEDRKAGIDYLSYFLNNQNTMKIRIGAS